MDKILEYFSDLGVTAGMHIVYAVLILVVGIFLVKRLVKLVEKNKAFKKVEKGLQSFIISFLKILLYIMVFMSAAYVLGVPMTSFITILASAGLAIGMALQGALSNFAGGIMLLVFKPFKVGDKIEANNYLGFVTDITVFYTYLNTLDGRKVMLPNGTLSNNSIVNYSANKLRRIDLIFSVAYDSDIDKVKKIIMDTAIANENTVSEPKAPQVHLYKQNDSSLDFQLWIWCPEPKCVDTGYELNEQIKKAFDENGIEIPYPQMDVHVKQ
ncbi:MAG: mechanosensitive ion channel family protein [Firmicutes bacterium]|nr:mechanosensitive ion channel family protein [Bacillota bacterium]